MCSQCRQVLPIYQADPDAFGSLSGRDVVLLHESAKHCRLVALAAAARSTTDHLFDENVGAALDSLMDRLPEHLRVIGSRIAMGMGYTSSEERDANRNWNRDHGFCTHGIEWGHCPVGCESANEA